MLLFLAGAAGAAWLVHNTFYQNQKLAEAHERINQLQAQVDAQAPTAVAPPPVTK